MSLVPKIDNFLDALKSSKIGFEISAELDAQKVAARQKVADELNAAHAEIESTWPALEKEADAALKAYRSSEEKLALAAQRLNAATAAKSAASCSYTVTRARLEQELSESASPEIDRALSWIADELHNLPRHFVVRRWNEATLTGGTKTIVSNNAQSIETRRAALLEMKEAALQMKVIPNQAQVGAALAALRDAIPAISMDA